MVVSESPRRRARPLRDDERKLWAEVARSIKPLKPRRLILAAPEDARKTPPAAGARVAAANPPAPPLPPKTPTPSPSSPPSPPSPPPLAPLGRRMRQRIGRGAEPIARRLDLHGMTQHEAHHALSRFLFAAQADDARLVLVITGKGARADGDAYVERGVLRRLVPQWLRMAEFRGVVMGFEAAGVGHGGEGALYVRLRRARGG
jgi:DNA-nicking Smr family endonuclease